MNTLNPSLASRRQLPPGVRLVVRRDALFSMLLPQAQEAIVARFFDALPSVYEGLTEPLSQSAQVQNEPRDFDLLPDD